MSYGDSNAGFQFLIGTIKTLVAVTVAASAAQVSIPYRYDKNCLQRRPDRR